MSDLRIWVKAILGTVVAIAIEVGNIPRAYWVAMICVTLVGLTIQAVIL